MPAKIGIRSAGAEKSTDDPACTEMRTQKSTFLDEFAKRCLTAKSFTVGSMPLLAPEDSRRLDGFQQYLQ
jgi:hypothetical protein